MYRVIFEHIVKTGQEQAFIDQWQDGSDVIQSYPGARGTLLFKSKDSDNTYYAMAEWESIEARQSAMSEIAKREDAEIIMHGHEQYVEKYTTLLSADHIASSLPKS